MSWFGFGREKDWEEEAEEREYNEATSWGKVKISYEKWRKKTIPRDAQEVREIFLYGHTLEELSEKDLDWYDPKVYHRDLAEKWRQSSVRWIGHTRAIARIGWGIFTGLLVTTGYVIGGIVTGEGIGLMANSYANKMPTALQAEEDPLYPSSLYNAGPMQVSSSGKKNPGGAAGTTPTETPAPTPAFDASNLEKVMYWEGVWDGGTVDIATVKMVIDTENMTARITFERPEDFEEQMRAYPYGGNTWKDEPKAYFDVYRQTMTATCICTVDIRTPYSKRWTSDPSEWPNNVFYLCRITKWENGTPFIWAVSPRDDGNYEDAMFYVGNGGESRCGELDRYFGDDYYDMIYDFYFYEASGYKEGYGEYGHGYYNNSYKKEDSRPYDDLKCEFALKQYLTGTGHNDQICIKEQKLKAVRAETYGPAMPAGEQPGGAGDVPTGEKPTEVATATPTPEPTPVIIAPGKPTVTANEGGSVEVKDDGTAVITPDAGKTIYKITINGQPVPIKNGQDPTTLTGLTPNDQVEVEFRSEDDVPNGTPPQSPGGYDNPPPQHPGVTNDTPAAPGYTGGGGEYPGGGYPGGEISGGGYPGGEYPGGEIPGGGYPGGEYPGGGYPGGEIPGGEMPEPTAEPGQPVEPTATPTPTKEAEAPTPTPEIKRPKLHSGSTRTRAQFLHSLWVYTGWPKASRTENPFTDVLETDYYYEAVMWALDCGLIETEEEPCEFEPHRVCTYWEMIVIMTQYYKVY